MVTHLRCVCCEKKKIGALVILKKLEDKRVGGADPPAVFFSVEAQSASTPFCSNIFRHTSYLEGDGVQLQREPL